MFGSKVTTGRESGSDGFALVLVLVAIVLLGLILETVQYMSDLAVNEASAADLHARLECAADAAVSEGILRLLDKRPTMHWPVDGTPQLANFGGFEVSVAIQSEGGKVNLNIASRKLLFGLFLAAGLDTAHADMLTDSVLDWREPGEFRRLNGAKSADYRAADLSYGPRLGAFQTIDELKLVKGMTPNIYDRVEDGITVYNLFSSPQLETAPPIVLSALGLDNASIEEIMAARSRQNMAPFRELPGQHGVAQFPGGALMCYTIIAEANEGGQRVMRRETVRFTGHPDDPFWVLATD